MELTKTEKYILKFAGFPREDIAKKTGKSIEAIKWHLRRLHKKFGVSTRYQLILKALLTGYIYLDEIDTGFSYDDKIIIGQREPNYFTRAHKKDFRIDTKGVIKDNLRRWTQTAKECYMRNCVCDGCDVIPEKYHNLCKMKNCVIQLYAQKGKPKL